jgi:hypothetical protein
MEQVLKDRMKTASVYCDAPTLLAGSHNAHSRLIVAALIGSGAAGWWHGQAPLSWIVVLGMGLLAVNAGFASLWSP